MLGGELTTDCLPDTRERHGRAATQMPLPSERELAQNAKAEMPKTPRGHRRPELSSTGGGFPHMYSDGGWNTGQSTAPSMVCIEAALRRAAASRVFLAAIRQLSKSFVSSRPVVWRLDLVNRLNNFEAAPL